MTGTWPVMHIRAKRGRRKPSPNSKCLETALSQLLSSQPSLGTVSLCDGKKPSDIRWCLVSDTRPQGLTVNLYPLPFYVQSPPPFYVILWR